MTELRKNDRLGRGLVGFAEWGLYVVGSVGLLSAFASLDHGDYAGAGSCLLASAVSFGLALHALLRP